MQWPIRPKPFVNKIVMDIIKIAIKKHAEKSKEKKLNKIQGLRRFNVEGWASGGSKEWKGEWDCGVFI